MKTILEQLHCKGNERNNSCRLNSLHSGSCAGWPLSTGATLRQRSIRVQQHLRKAIDAFVELVVPVKDELAGGEPHRRMSSTYAIGASSRSSSCDTTNEGFARPEMIKSLKYRLYDFTLHWPVPSDRPFSNSLPKLSKICPLPL